MDLCQKMTMATSCDPPLISKTIKKNQQPACDTFGPFPDETVLSNIDRLLYLLGAQRIQRMLNLPFPSVDVVPNDVTINVEVPCPPSCGSPRSSERSCTTIITESSGRSSICLNKCNCPKCNRKPCTPRVKIVKECEPAPPSKKCPQMKRSFSLCSLACRKLKQVCFQGNKNNQNNQTCDLGSQIGALFAGGCNLPPSKWIWTRMYCHPSGCEVYEIFKKSCTCMHPSQIKIKSSPKLIFVVLPNGIVMPFETLSCHK